MTGRDLRGLLKNFLEELLSREIPLDLENGRIKISKDLYKGIKISLVAGNNKEEYSITISNPENFLRLKLTEYFAKRLGGRILEGKEFLGGLVLGNNYVVYLFDGMVVDKIIEWDSSNPILEPVVRYIKDKPYIMIEYRNEWEVISKYLNDIREIVQKDKEDIISYLKNEFVNYAVNKLKKEIEDTLDWLDRELSVLKKEVNEKKENIKRLEALRNLLNMGYRS